MQLTESHKQYWSKNVRMTGFLLALWFIVTFVVGYYARDLNFNFFVGKFLQQVQSYREQDVKELTGGYVIAKLPSGAGRDYNSIDDYLQNHRHVFQIINKDK